ncbi:glutamate--cysteine ligase [Nonomuraea sp. NPDC050310]|uniref:carboxylate-amine ligase n=1 Tax=unclassified Nonomuraea TaxID=2593643 RepID=UPI0033F35C09
MDHSRRTTSCPPASATSRGRPPTGTAVPPVGVEEEFFLVDPCTGRAAPRAGQVVAKMPPRFRGLLQREFAACQVEAITTPHHDLADLGEQAGTMRAELAAAARDAGCRLIASGTIPFERPGRAVLTEDPRYRMMAREYGAVLVGDQSCGCHVHVEVPDLEEAVQVCNHLRPWLPTLLALTANSPLVGCTDSGHAAWRARAQARWPTVDFPPYLDSVQEYRETVEAMLCSGVILDEAMIYWLVRPSHHLPTVEVRVADACATAGETVLLAAIVRALVSTVLGEVRSGLPAPQPPESVLRAAHWRAAHDGLEGNGLDLATRKLVPAWRLVGELVTYLTPALSAAGDLPMVARQLTWLRRVGCGAARQRMVYGCRGGAGALTAYQSRQTAGR